MEGRGRGEGVEGRVGEGERAFTWMAFHLCWRFFSLSLSFISELELQVFVLVVPFQCAGCQYNAL